jgi:hypothetical protein
MPRPSEARQPRRHMRLAQNEAPVRVRVALQRVVVLTRTAQTRAMYDALVAELDAERGRVEYYKSVNNRLETDIARKKDIIESYKVENDELTERVATLERDGERDRKQRDNFMRLAGLVWDRLQQALDLLPPALANRLRATWREEGN